MVDEQQQRRINEAAEEFANAVVDSYRTVAERGATAQDLNAELTQQFFNAVINHLQRSTEEMRGASQDLAGQTQRGQEAAQQLTQESVSAYMDFVNSMFSFYQTTPEATERGAREAGR